MYFTRRQLEILEFIYDWREKNGVSPSLEEMAKNFGVSKITIHDHLNHLEEKGAIRREKFRSRSVELRVTPQSRRHRRDSLPLLGAIRAGAPLEQVSTRDTLNLIEVFPLDSSCFALRVEGQSMIDDQIRDGDYVVVREAKTANNGDTVVAVLESGEATLKRYYREPGHVRLQPANDDMEPILAKNVEIRGVVVGLLRNF